MLGGAFFHTLVMQVILLISYQSQAQTFEVVATNDIVQNIDQSTKTIDDWAAHLNTSDYKILCLGETHKPQFRTLYSKVFEKLVFNKLALEITKKEALELKTDWEQGRPLEVLSVTFDPIAEVLDRYHPKVSVYGVEQTQLQKKEALDAYIENGKKVFSRDGFIAQNIIEANTEEVKMVALYGSNHCSVNDQGAGSVPFMNYLKNYWSPSEALSVKVMFRKGNNHPLLGYLRALPDKKDAPVVLMSELLKPQMHNYKWEIVQLTQNFDYIIII